MRMILFRKVILITKYSKKKICTTVKRRLQMNRLIDSQIGDRQQKKHNPVIKLTGLFHKKCLYHPFYRVNSNSRYFGSGQISSSTISSSLST
jgi:hypothetical protein